MMTTARIKRYPRMPLLGLVLSLASCEAAKFSDKRAQELATTDATLQQVNDNATAHGIALAFSVDHSRLAEKAGEVLAANKVSFYSNPRINSQILSHNIRAGLDLPFRIQAFYHQGVQQLGYTGAAFLSLRHGVDKGMALDDFDQTLKQLRAGLKGAQALNTRRLSQNYGIVELTSAFGVAQSVERLKAAILAEGDTVWFYDIDYQQQARAYDIALPEARLMVFGAPAPGAKAMRDFPAIGLDAFAQKVLVYQQGAEVKVIYNHIPSMAKLHYNETALAHYVIAYRLKKTLSAALTDNDE